MFEMRRNFCVVVVVVVDVFNLGNEAIPEGFVERNCGVNNY